MDSNQYLNNLLSSLRPPTVSSTIEETSRESAAPTATELSQLLNSLSQSNQALPSISSNIPSHDQLQALLSSMASSSTPSPNLNNFNLTNSVPYVPSFKKSTTVESMKRREMMTFSEAIPIISSMMNSEFIEDLNSIKSNQDLLELSLLDERKRLESEMKRKLIGEKAIESALKKWDFNTVEKWRKLRSEQQGLLQRMGIPGFYVTTDLVALSRQDKIMQMLIGMIEE